MKKKLSLLLTILMIFSLFTPVQAAVSSSEIDQAIQRNYEMLKKVDPKMGSVGGEWTVLCMVRSELPLADGYLERYSKHIDSVVSEKQGKLSKNKFTEYSRLIVALSSFDKDVTNVGGYNLLEGLSNFNNVIKQGINGPIWALIALDTKGYDIPKIADGGAQNSRERMINEILSREVPGGGWALMGNKADPDITAMALYSLWPYYNSNPQVKAAYDRAMVALSELQLPTGGYETMGDENSESSAQVIIALATMGVDPDKDSRFIKYDASGNGKSVLDALMTYQDPKGGFKHVHSEASANAMGTDQATEALIAVKRLRTGKTALFDYKNGTEKNQPQVGNQEGFTDIESSWAKELISSTKGYGITNGERLFKPNQDITRAEFAVAIVHGLGIGKGDKQLNFGDIKEDAWYKKSVDAASSQGIIYGTGEGRFDPNKNITREEAMAMIQRAIKVKTGKADVDKKKVDATLKNFNDGASVSNWAKEAVAYTIQVDIVKGRPEGIVPKGNISRAESISIVNRASLVK